MLPRTKKYEVEAAISLYRAQRDPIYIKIISLCFMSHVSKEFTKAVPRAMDQIANPKLNGTVIKEILFFNFHIPYTGGVETKLGGKLIRGLGAGD